MAVIGVFGSVVFEVSEERARSFDGLTHDTGMRTTSHDVIGESPLIEIIGPDGESIGFTMRFLRQLGVDPRAEVEKLQTMRRTGTRAALVLGTSIFGGDTARWIIDKISESYPLWSGSGLPLEIDVSVSLKKAVSIS